MIKGDGKNQRHHEQEHEDVLVIGADNQEEKEADDENQELGGDYVRENRAYEKAVFTFEERQANRAMMPDMERAVYDFGLATGRTKQLEAAFQDANSLFFI